MTTLQWREKWWALAFMALSSCSSTGDDINGNLGNGTFSYICVNADDPACASTSGGTGETGASPTNFPAAVANGAHFKVTYAANNTTQGGNPTLKPVAPEYISELSADGSLTALKPGKDAMVARSSVNGLVFDFTEITISPISSLGVTDQNGEPLPTTLQISVGSTNTLLATALGPRSEKLAGGVDYTWKSSDDTIVHLEEGNPTAHVDLDALKAGSATLTVTQGDPTQGGMTVTIPVTVTQ
jgi:hypothetical protein